MNHVLAGTHNVVVSISLSIIASRGTVPMSSIGARLSGNIDARVLEFLC